MLRTKRSRLSRGGWPRYSRRHSARSCGVVRSFRAASFCDNSAGEAGPISPVPTCLPSPDRAVGRAFSGRLFRCFGVNAVSHYAHRRAFGARCAPPTQKCCPGPWHSGRGREAIAAGARVGLLRY